jgi:Reverse transcriptase (RNA-dependent DNA polymerase)
LIENIRFTPVTDTNGMKPIGCRWVYKTKRNPNGTTRYKARLVIKGYEQIRGVHFDETYVPVSKLITLRYLLSFAAQNNYKIDHLDVVTAFLNPEIDAEVYMQLPEGIDWLESTTTPSGNRDCFLRLNKALYGLRQAPRLWHQEIDGFLQSIGFHRSHADMGLYIRSDGVLILLYVDDILVFYADEASEKALEAM